MADKRVFLNGMEVVNTPKFKEKDGLEWCVFNVRDEKDVLTVVCFDDERQKSPFKTIKKLCEDNKFGKDTFINCECDLSFYPAKVISDDKWKKLSQGENPTEVLLPSFRIYSWSFAIPLKIHEKLKEKKSKKTVPIKIESLADEFGA